MKAKKQLGQHFLKSEQIALDIVNALNYNTNQLTDCIEIGPGKGVLTKYLLERKELNLKVVELDVEAIEYLNLNLPQISDKIIHSDILKLDFSQKFKSPLFVIGNIPYNITGPIFFQILEYREMIPQTVMMIQREVAQRISAKHGSKVYGILSVLLQAFYDVEYLFTVDETVFNPPPKVKSAVVRLTKKKIQPDIQNWELLKSIVKTAFNQRRKTMKNAMASMDISKIPEEYLPLRAEQLSVEDFLRIYKCYL